MQIKVNLLTRTNKYMYLSYEKLINHRGISSGVWLGSPARGLSRWTFWENPENRISKIFRGNTWRWL